VPDDERNPPDPTPQQTKPQPARGNLSEEGLPEANLTFSL